MAVTKSVSCDSLPNLSAFPREILYAEIPDSGVLMMSFVEAYHRLNGNTEVLQNGFQFESWQYHVAMAWYLGCQEKFDAEYRRVMDERQKWLAEFLEKTKDKNGWAELRGAWPGNETDEEIDAALERLS